MKNNKKDKTKKNCKPRFCKTVFYIITSTNVKSLKLFMSEFYSLVKSSSLTYVKVMTCKPKKTVFSLLTSPHVNKTAQENFQELEHKKIVRIEDQCQYDFLVFFKELIKAHPSVKVKANIFVNKLKTADSPDLKKSEVLCPDTLVKTGKIEKNDIPKYVKALDLYGSAIRKKGDFKI